MVVDLPAVAPRPRAGLLRLAYTIVIMVGFLAGPWLVSLGARHFGGGAAGHWPPPALVVLVLGALAATRVSYRWFDAFLLLVPFVGLVYLYRFAWRLAFLPYRDWPPRPDEEPRWRKVAHPERPGAGLYLVEPARRR